MLAGRTIGPIAGAPPCNGLWGDAVAAPLGLVPKAVPHGEPPLYRMIFDLSHGQTCMNESIPGELTHTTYPSFEQVVQRVAALGPSAHMALFDVKAAYRQLPNAPQDFPALRMGFHGHFYIEACLPFGVASGPAIYSIFGQAVSMRRCWRMRGLICCAFWTTIFLCRPRPLPAQPRSARASPCWTA